MVKKSSQPQSPEYQPVEPLTAQTEPSPDPLVLTEPAPLNPAHDPGSASNGHASPLEKARAARKAMGYVPKSVFYVIVGISKDGGNRDILGDGKSRRGAEKLMEQMKAATSRSYASVEVWKCRK